MNNSPGWASPGSAPSDEPDRGTQEHPTQPPVPEGRPGTDEQPAPPNWSRQQPPAGQWSAPGTIPGQSGPGPRGRADSGGGWGGARPPGPNGGPGWGGGWAPGPHAAKPGVIPLRPLGVGEILDGAVATMRAHWRTVLGISLVIAVIAQTAITLVTGVWFQGTDRTPTLESTPDTSIGEALREAGNTLTASALTSVIGLLATITATGLLTIVVSRAVLGRSVSTGEAWQEARPQLPRLFGLLVLLPLLLTAVIVVSIVPGIVIATLGSAPVGLALGLLGGLAGTVAAVWLWVCCSLASPALMLEKQGVTASMRRSAKLVRGSWWRVLGIQLLTYLLIGIVGFIVQIPATLISFLIGGDSLMDWANGAGNSTGWTFLTVLGIGAVISSAITFPISAGVTALLYMDQRIRREALDLELARAAGLPGYGTHAATPRPHTGSHPTTGSPAASGPAATTASATPPPPGTPDPAGPAADASARPADTTVPEPRATGAADLTKTEPGSSPATDPEATADGSGPHSTDPAPGS
ncbi:hypothetical protein [Streptomyces pinistramenti]|uniref:hypothetical protein n=1 Tax=Streptomyces pinistramenti TaxID=2884812 RepID=UPI001D098F4F|nr:hypothetical protein [Streptomyces pinistramenti]MCB5912049.1 hypothetical protein [Streptomyces pinistramenti]